MKTDHLSEYGWRFEKTPEGWTHCYDPEGVQRCGVKTRSKGTPCRQTRVRQTGRCGIHQPGKQKVGFAHHRTKTGKHSKYLNALPSRLADNYRSVLSEENLMDLNENVALMDVLIMDLLPRLHQGDLGKLWVDLVAKFDEMNDDLRLALNQRDAEALQRFIENFREGRSIAKKGRQDWVTRREILDVTNQRRQLVKTKADVEYRGENAITMRDFVALLEVMENIFYEVNRIDDADERRQAYAEKLQQKVINIEDIS